MVSNTAATRVAGGLKKKIIRDILLGFGIGVPLATGWWYSYHVANAKKRDEWYLEYARKRESAEEE